MQETQVTDIRICDLDNIDLIPCAAGTNNAGALVTDERLCQAPNDQNKCPPGSDLENVYVMNPDLDGACDIFEECEPDDPIFSALPDGSSTFEVVDDQICNLEIPEEIELFECDPLSNLGDGALVTDPQLCNAATPAEQCPEDSTLAGVWVHPDELATCNLVLPETCPPGTALEGVSVSNTEFCDLNGLEKCPANTEQAGHFVMGDGNLDTTTELTEVCSLPDAMVCGADTDLEGVVVSEAPTDCFLNTCPLGTPLAGVVLNITEFQNDDSPADGTPDVCTIQGLDKCISGDLAGHFVMDTDMNTVFDDILPDVQEDSCDLEDAMVCGADTDLEGVVVSEAPTDCFLNTCPLGTPLAGVVLNITEFQNDDSPADGTPDVCTIQGLDKCISGDLAGHFVMDTDMNTVFDDILPDVQEDSCDLEDAMVCGADTDLEGVVVSEAPTDCFLNTCPLGTPLAGVVLNITEFQNDDSPADGTPDVCTIQGLDKCISGDLAGHFVMDTDMNTVFDDILPDVQEDSCDLEDAMVCGADTDLEGVVVSEAPTDCFLNTCPLGTPLAGVVLNITEFQNDDSPADGTPDVCTIQGLDKCISGDLAGHFVMDTDMNTVFDDILPDVQEDSCDLEDAMVCGADTDLEGVVVSEAPTDCFLNTCPLGTPLAGVVLNITEFQNDDSPADGTPDVCTIQGLDKCISGDLAGHFVMDTDMNTVFDDILPDVQEDSCDLEDAMVCGADTDLEGVVVSEAPTDCFLNTCPLGTPLAGVVLNITEFQNDDSPADGTPDVCTIQGLDKCISGDLAGHFVMDTDMNTVFDDILPDVQEDSCDLEDAMVCGADTDLEGVVVSEAPTDCFLNTCPLGTPLAGVVLNITEFQNDDSPADGTPDVCTIQGLDKCISGDLAGHFVMDTDMNTVFDDILPDVQEDSCDLEDAMVCGADTDLEGVVVSEAPTDCFLNTCPLGTPLAGVVLNITEFQNDDSPADGTPDVCTIQGLDKCISGDLAGHFVMDTDMNTVFDDILPDVQEDSCDLEDAMVCGADTDLEGVVVSEAPTDCFLNTCPLGTPLAGVVLNITEFQNDDSPADGTPDVCTLGGLEKCPAGTDLEGVFAMGDGNLTTTAPDPLAPTCPECIQNALNPTQEVTFANYLAGFGLNLNTYCALSSFQGSDTVGEVRDWLEGDFSPSPPGSGIILSDTQLDELAQCIFGALNPDTMLQDACSFNICPDTSQIPGAIVTDLDLCDLVTEQNKECQTCATLVNSLLAPSAVNIVFDAINAFDPAPPGGGTGLEEICTSDDPITAYNTFVDQIPYPPADPGLKVFLKEKFATCEGVVGDTCDAVTVTPNITGFNAPRDIEFDPIFDRMYVVTRDGGGSVSVISTATNAQIAGSPILGVGTSPFGIAYDPVNLQMYVANCEGSGCNTVSRINTASNPPALIAGTITVGTAPFELAYDPEHKRMYVTNLGGTTVSVIDTTQNPPVETQQIAVGNAPWGIAYDPFHKTMYVTNFGSNSVSVISTNTNTVIATIPAGGNLNGPTDITYDPVHERMYVTNFGGDTVSVIDTETNGVISTITHSSFADPVYVTYDPINQDMYVTNQAGTTVSVIDTGTNGVTGTINLAPNASGLIGIAYDPVNQRMYVGGRDTGTVSVINLCPAILDLAVAELYYR